VNISRFGMGDGRIWFDNVNCTGTEEHIGECSRDDWGVYNCEHRNDVAVYCTDNTSATLPTGLRLVGGSRSRGRLEILHNGVWGTVCGHYFTATEERLVCKMLGFASGTKVGNANYLTSHGPIWLDKLRCNGTERDIAKCSHNGWGVHNCEHSDDVAVSCTGTHVDQVRLKGGRDPREGRLEMLYNGTWSAVSVCLYYGSEFNNAAAKIVCNMLGFRFVGRAISNTFGNVVGANVFTALRCRGTKQSISDCFFARTVSYCRSWRVAAVSCLQNNAVTLVGGRSPREGRLELYHRGTWGTVCDDRFTDAAARVVCYSLGFGYVGRKININVYGSGKGQIWLDDVQCNGSERRVSKCSHRGWGVHNCGHNEDVAVSCVRDSSETSSRSSSRIKSSSITTSKMTSPSTVSSTTSIQSPHQRTTQTSSPVFPCQENGRVALVGGISPREGRLEVCHNDIWGTVCDDGFNEAAARVVCNSLGYGYVGGEIEIDAFPIGKGQIWLDDIQCNGTERHISECSHRGWGVHNCVHKEDVAVSCIRDSSTTVVTSTTSISTTQKSSAEFTLKSTTSTQLGRNQFHSTSSSNSTSAYKMSSQTSSSAKLALNSTTTTRSGSDQVRSTTSVTSTFHSTTPTQGSSDQFHTTSPTSTKSTSKMMSQPTSISTTSSSNSTSTSKITSQTSSTTKLTLHSTNTIRSDSDQVRRTSSTTSTLHSTTSTQGSSDQFHSTSPASTKSTSMMLSHPTSISTTSVRSSINRAAPDTTQNIIDMTPIIIAAVVVGGLLLIIIVVVFAIRFLRLRRKPRRQERTEMAMTPVTASASTNNYNNDAFGEAAKNENPPVNDQASNYTTYSDIQPSSSPAGGSVGDVGSGDKPFAQYDMLPGDQ